MHLLGGREVASRVELAIVITARHFTYYMSLVRGGHAIYRHEAQSTCLTCLKLGIERVLGSDPGVRVFAPQYPARKGRVLGQLQYLPPSKTILIELTLVIC